MYKDALTISGNSIATDHDKSLDFRKMDKNIRVI